MSKAAKNQGAKNRAAKRQRNELKRANIRKRNMTTLPTRKISATAHQRFLSRSLIGASAGDPGVIATYEYDGAEVERIVASMVDQASLADRWPTVASAKAAAKDAGMSGYSSWKAATLDQHRRDLAEHLASTNQA